MIVDIYHDKDRVMLRCGKNAVIFGEREPGGYYLFYIEETGEVVRLSDWNIYAKIGNWTDAIAGGMVGG